MMNPIPHKISFEQAHALMHSGRPYAFLDVRTEEEYIVEHAEGATLLPLDDITAQSAAAAIAAPDTPVLLYCRTGRRSGLAAQKLAALGYRNLLDLGSLSGWPYGREYGL